MTYNVSSGTLNPTIPHYITIYLHHLDGQVFGSIAEETALKYWYPFSGRELSCKIIYEKKITIFN